MKKILISTLILLVSYMSNAQESISLSLNQAIDYALLNNYSAINANRDVDIAKKKK